MTIGMLIRIPRKKLMLLGSLLLKLILKPVFILSKKQLSIIKISGMNY